MNNNDVESFINGLVDFVGTLFSAAMTAIEMIPQAMLGFFLIGLVLIWAWKKVTG
jgi:hypothetical protein